MHPPNACRANITSSFAFPLRPLRLCGEFHVAIAVVLIMGLARAGMAQVSAAGELIRETTEQLFRQTGREGLEQLTEMGGREAVQQVLEQSAREGGEQLVKRVGQYGIEQGPAALDGLAPTMRSAGIEAVERNPQVITNLVKQFGPGALDAAVRHPGVGEKLVQTLGSDGIKLGRELTTDQSIVAARYAKDIADLAPAEKSGVLSQLGRFPNHVLNYLETHPRTLRTAAGVAVIMAIKDDIIGDRGSTILRPDGTVVTTASRPGLIERMFPSVSQYAYRPVMLICSVIAIGIAGWFGVHLWGKWRVQAKRA